MPGLAGLQGALPKLIVTPSDDGVAAPTLIDKFEYGSLQLWPLASAGSVKLLVAVVKSSNWVRPKP